MVIKYSGASIKAKLTLRLITEIGFYNKQNNTEKSWTKTIFRGVNTTNFGIRMRKQCGELARVK